MARIKYVINERRLAYEGAVKILEQKRQAQLAKIEAGRQAEESSLLQAEARVDVEPVPTSPTPLKEGRVESLAAAGLFAQPADGASQKATRS